MNPKNPHLEIEKIKSLALAHEIQWRNIAEHLHQNKISWALWLKARGISSMLADFRDLD